MSTHPHSRLAFQEGLKGPFSERCQAILDCLNRFGPLTDREVMARLGFSDTNTTRPRITEMLSTGVLEEAGEKIDLTTKKLVRIVRIKQSQADPRQSLISFSA